MSFASSEMAGSLGKEMGLLTILEMLVAGRAREERQVLFVDFHGILIPEWWISRQKLVY